MEKKSTVPGTSCDDCLWFDYADDTDDKSCTLQLDEDEMQRFLSNKSRFCPYYRAYDEYKTVRKQN